MRRIHRILTTALLLLALAGCGAEKEAVQPSLPAAPPAGEEAAEVLQLEELEIEVTRGSRTPEELMTALRELPEQLRTALEEQNVAVERITVTVGASPEATVLAVTEGGVDIAFLPAETFAAQEIPPRLLLAGGGGKAFLCAGDTEYGRNLALRKEQTWEEVSHACWGVTETLVPALDLYLADRYRGNTGGDLPELTVFESEEALRQAAESGGLDLLLSAVPQEGDTVLAETERLYTAVAVAAEGAPEGESFARALAAAAETVESDLLGGVAYEPAENGDLNPLRRLLNLRGE